MVRYPTAGQVVAKLIANLGSIVRIGPNQLITNDPEVFRRTSAVRSGYRRSNWYTGTRIEADHGHVLSERDEDRHNELRAKLAAGVS
jgi:hypothetical protein